MTCYHYYLWFLCYDRLIIGQKVQATWHYNAFLYLLSNDSYWLLFANFSTRFKKKKHCEFRITCQKRFFSKRWNNKKKYKHCYQLQKELFNEPARNVITANWRKVSLIFVFKHQFRTEKMRWIKLRSFVCLNTVWPEKLSYILDWAESFQNCI